MESIHDAIGGYIYTRSESRWEKLNDVRESEDRDEIQLITSRVGYESVPYDTRQQAYESFREIENDPDAPDKDHLIIGWEDE